MHETGVTGAGVEKILAEPVDPITVSVIQHRLTAIVAEMGEAMLRTSYSQILNSSRDFSTAICDAQNRLVAQAEHIPIHVGALAYAAEAISARFADTVRPGDVYLLNDPYFGGSHLPDVTAFVPVFADDRLLFWTINRAHHSDIGGATHGAYNPAATSIFQEGLRIPPLKLYDQGVVRQDLLDMIATNTRHPRDFKGDLAAQIGSVHGGERRMQALIGEFGVETVLSAVESSLDAAEEQARAVIATWPDGVYRGEAALDDDGHGQTDVTIRATITKRGSDLEVDLSESDPQSPGFVNSSYANMRSAVAMSIAYLMDAETPRNHGSLRPLTVKAKRGTIVWSEDGAPVTMCTSHCSNEICEAIVVALSEACPERAMAGWGRRFRVAIQGEDPNSGRGFIWHMFHARPGAGGSSGGDGWHNSGEWHSAGGLKFGSVELAEARFPLHFRKHEFRAGSAGDGQFRGGNGVELEFVLETDQPAVANTAGDGNRHGSRGMVGGQDGQPHDYRLRRKDGSERILKTKEILVPVEPGDTFVIHSSGGGGWGDPNRRDSSSRAADVLNELVRITGE